MYDGMQWTHMTRGRRSDREHETLCACTRAHVAVLCGLSLVVVSSQLWCLKLGRCQKAFTVTPTAIPCKSESLRQARPANSVETAGWLMWGCMRESRTTTSGEAPSEFLHLMCITVRTAPRNISPITEISMLAPNARSLRFAGQCNAALAKTLGCV